jgi:ATP-binding cassette subfamily F protein 3
LIVLEGVSLGFGRKTIVTSLDLRIGEQDRIGLVGPNGSGKTTLLRVLADEQGVDHGEVRRSRGVRVGYLPQDIALEGGRALMEFVLGSVPGRAELDAELADVEARLAKTQEAVDTGDQASEDELMTLAQHVADLHERITHFDTFFTEHEAARILAGLGFSAQEHGRDLGELSGGWKMRAVLAALLFQKPELLLLDEPTNHLDMPSVAWFSDFLRRYSRAFVLICHDREFLDEQIDRVVSFEPEGVRQYKGNYEQYRRQRAEEEIVLENKARNLAREREKAEQFIDRFRAQANKARAVQSRVKALEKMEDVETYQKREVMRIAFPPCARAGGDVIRVSGLAKAYGDHVVFDGIDLVVRRGEKIGIIGVNGAGKTTLLKMLAGELEPDAGEIRLGANVALGYYAQHHTETLHPESTVFDEVASVDPSSGQTRVRSILGAFLFSGDDVEKKVRVLSGGERSRVALARLLLEPGNLLLMDEPTNHLDLESSEALAESLASYDGTIVFVSHNRSFVNRLATRIWDVADRHVETYPGTLDEYMASARERGLDSSVVAGSGAAATEPAPSRAEPNPAPPARGSKSDARPSKRSREAERARKREEARLRSERRKRVGPLEKRVAQLEARIARLETEQKQRSVELADPAVYEDDARRADLLGAYQNAAAELDDLSAQWEVAQADLEDALAED